MRTPLTYYGGKQKLAKQIIELMPPHKVYLEPFAGGAAVLFAKPRAQREMLNDLDGQIIRFWRAIRDRPEEVATAVAATPYSRDEWRATRDVVSDDDVEAARQLLVSIDQSFSRSRASWSPPCITTGRGRWQPGTWENLPPKILAAVDRLRGVALENKDALKLLPRWDRDDALIYLDPPYAGPHRLSPGKGYAEEGGADLMDRLVEVLLEMEHASMSLSGYPCKATQRLKRAGWKEISLSAKRTVQSREKEKLAAAPEKLWCNRLAIERNQ